MGHTGQFAGKLPATNEVHIIHVQRTFDNHGVLLELDGIRRMEGHECIIFGDIYYIPAVNIDAGHGIIRSQGGVITSDILGIDRGSIGIIQGRREYLHGRVQITIYLTLNGDKIRVGQRSLRYLIGRNIVFRTPGKIAEDGHNHNKA